MRRRFSFGLGCAHPGHLRRYRGPAFVALPCLRDVRTLPEPAPEVDWLGIDSGGYVNILKHGGWPWGVGEHAEQGRRMVRWLGPRLGFVATMDWMAWPPRAIARTGLSVAEHVRRSAESWSALLAEEPAVPWAPVLQGGTLEDYLRCADWTELAARRSLREAPAVLIGSIAARAKRRDGTTEAWVVDLVRELAGRGLAVHVLGSKGRMLRDCVAAGARFGDSLAWSSDARNGKRDLARWLGLENPDYPPKPAILLELAERTVALRGEPGHPGAARGLRALRVTRGKCPANSVEWAETWRADQEAHVAEGLALRDAAGMGAAA